MSLNWQIKSCFLNWKWIKKIADYALPAPYFRTPRIWDTPLSRTRYLSQRTPHPIRDSWRGAAPLQNHPFIKHCFALFIFLPRILQLTHPVRFRSMKLLMSKSTTADRKTQDHVHIIQSDSLTVIKNPLVLSIIGHQACPATPQKKGINQTHFSRDCKKIPNNKIITNSN